MRSVAIIIVGGYFGISFMSMMIHYIIDNPESDKDFYLSICTLLVSHVILMGLLSEQSQS